MDNTLKLTDWKRKTDQAEGKKLQIKSSLNKVESDLKALVKTRSSAEKALYILQTVAKQTQEQLEYRVSELVSLALESVFEEPYKMVLRYEDKRGKTEASLLFERNGSSIDPLNASGGGVVDVAAFALRVALWCLSGKKSSSVLILDEPFRFVSKDLLPKVGGMIKEISDKLGLQIIMVTHLNELIESSDTVFHVHINQSGVSQNN